MSRANFFSPLDIMSPDSQDVSGRRAGVKDRGWMDGLIVKALGHRPYPPLRACHSASTSAGGEGLRIGSRDLRGLNTAEDNSVSCAKRERLLNVIKQGNPFLSQ